MHNQPHIQEIPSFRPMQVLWTVRPLCSCYRTDFAGVISSYLPQTHLSAVGVEEQVAVAVGEAAFKEGVAGVAHPGDLEAFLRDRMWTPAQQKAREQPSKI